MNKKNILNIVVLLGLFGVIYYFYKKNVKKGNNDRISDSILKDIEGKTKDMIIDDNNMGDNKNEVENKNINDVTQLNTDEFILD